MSISEATYYNWKKYGGLGVSALRRLERLEEENQQFKQLVADLSLHKRMLQDTLINRSMDFVADNLFDGRKIRALAIVDNFRL